MPADPKFLEDLQARVTAQEAVTAERQLRTGRAILWLGALAPFIYTTPRTVETASGVTAIDLVRGGGPILAFAWIYVHPRFKEFPIRLQVAETALAGFLLVAFASAAWTDHSPMSVLLKATQLAFMYLCVAKVAATYPDFGAAVRAVLHVTHLILLAVLIQLLVAPSITYAGSDADPIPRLNSTIPAISANVLGVAIGAAILALLLRVGPRWATETWARWPLLATYALLLLATRSRIIAAVIAVALLAAALVAMWRSAEAFAGGLIAAAGGVAALWWVLESREAQAALADFLARGQTATGLATLTGRTVIWERALDFWSWGHTWWGAGYYTGHRFDLPEFDPLFRGYSNIDSTWIESLVDVGLVGTVLLAAFALIGTWRVLRVGTDRYTKALAWAVWVAILAVSTINPSLQSALYTAVVGGLLVFAAPRPSAPT